MESSLHTDAAKYQAGMGTWSKTLALFFMEFVGGIKEGGRLLDVGCGTGSLTFTVADTIKAAKIIGIDPSAGYLEYARAHNPYPHVAFEIGDAHQLRFEDNCFDCCVSSLMIQFLFDAQTAAKEMKRVTKRGGIVATCMWDVGGGMELSKKFWDAAVAVDSKVRPPVRSRYGSASGLAELWTVAGFVNVEIRPLVIPMEFRSFEDLWQRHSNSQGPPKPYIGSLSDDSRYRLKERLRSDILGNDSDRPFTLKAKAWAVRGMVP